MSTMVWDEAGARYYETGVSKGILWTPELLAAEGVGVPWNGLVAVNLDPQGGETEAYWFDGVKYMNRILAEDFQATIQTLSTPKEFRPCEGDREYAPGVMTSFNKRDKFHMAWRTEIGSDMGESVAYKWHIAYNNLAQPAGRNYQTIADTAAMDTRSITITATPACARSSYFWFDSRDYDLTALEAQLLQGILPKCFELSALVGTPDTSDECDVLFVDFEQYSPGETVDDDLVDDIHESIIHGVINNGLTVIELPAAGAYAANDSAASEVGTHPVLVDGDDATYITSADGDLGYTVALPPLVGYVPGSTIELHIRMSITGGVNSNNPDDIDADAQVHISTDAGGDDTIGGFSDGADEGMGFALSIVDGTIVDYVVPLSMDAWVDSTLDDVIAALKIGAYLNVVGASNNNADTTPEVRVYEAMILVINTTISDKALEAPAGDDSGSVEQHIYVPETTTDYVGPSVVTLDFLVRPVENIPIAEDNVQELLFWPITGSDPGKLQFEIDDSSGNPIIVSYDQGPGSELARIEPLSLNEWYRAKAHWIAGQLTVQVWLRSNPKVLLIDDTHTTSSTPVAFVKHFCGYAYTDFPTEVSYEVMIDNAKLSTECQEAPEWITLALSSAVFFSSSQDSNMEGEYDSGTGRIKSKLDSTSFSRHAQFHFPGFVLDPTKTYEFKAVYAAHTYGMGIYQQNPSWTSTFWADNDELVSTFAETDGDNQVVVTVGPGINDWDQAITDDYQTLIRFDMATNGDTGTVGGADLISISYREV